MDPYVPQMKTPAERAAHKLLREAVYPKRTIRRGAIQFKGQTFFSQDFYSCEGEQGIIISSSPKRVRVVTSISIEPIIAKAL